jgi:hypothetical protein
MGGCGGGTNRRRESPERKASMKAHAGTITVITATLILALAAAPLPSGAKAYAQTKAEKKQAKEDAAWESSLAELNSFTRKLMRERGAEKPEEKAWVIADYIHDPANGYEYKATPCGGLEFFRTKRGECAAYAELFTLMARAAGVKAKCLGSMKRNHAIAAFKAGGKWRYFDVTAAHRCWSKNKSLTLAINQFGRYEDGDEYKAAFLNRTGIVYEPDRETNRGYTDKIASRPFSTSTKNMHGLKSDDYKAKYMTDVDLSLIEWMKQGTLARVSASGRKGALALSVRKPLRHATRITAYEAQYRPSGAKKWSKTVTLKPKKAKKTVLKKLKRGKQYTVRVRAVKTIGGVEYRCRWAKAKAKAK